MVTKAEKYPLTSQKSRLLTHRDESDINKCVARIDDINQECVELLMKARGFYRAVKDMTFSQQYVETKTYQSGKATATTDTVILTVTIVTKEFPFDDPNRE